MRKGFTLLEVLLVVAAIAILAGIVIFAVNPGKQLADVRNAQRRVDVNTILNAVYQYAVDNSGSLPSEITTDLRYICKIGADCGGLNLVDVSELTDNEKYLVDLPLDPTGATADHTGYQIEKTSDGRVTVAAPFAEQGASITVTR